MGDRPVLALVVAAEQPDLLALDSILAAVTLTVLASVVLHGWGLCVTLTCVLGLPAAASASVTLGPPVANPAPLESQSLNWPEGSLLFTAAAPQGIQLTAPSDGVITRWRVYTDDVGAGATVQLRTLLPGAGDSYTPIASGAVEPLAEKFAGPAETHNVLHEFSAHLPIGAGQIVGIILTRAAPGALQIVLPFKASIGWKYGCLSCLAAAPPDGTPGTATFTENQWVALNAEVEPDVDGDLFGDETQDNCAGIANPSQADGDGDGRGDACDKEPPASPTQPSVVTQPSPVVTPALAPKKKKCKKGKRLKRGKCVKRKAAKKRHR